MKLEDKLNLICQESFVEDISRILNYSKGEVDWFGKAIFVSKGYEGDMNVQEFVNRYLKEWINKPRLQFDLKQRIDSLEILDRVKVLTEESTQALENTWLVKYLSPKRLFSSRSQASVSVDFDSDLHALNSKCREFSKEQFRKHFPHQEPESIIHTVIDAHVEEVWVVSKIQLIAAYCIV